MFLTIEHKVKVDKHALNVRPISKYVFNNTLSTN